MTLHSTALLAQVGGGAGLTNMLLMLGLMFAIMWFLVINPQRKQLRAHRDLLSSLKKGDEVVTQGGLMGKIYAIADKTLTLEISSGVRVRVLKTSVQGKASLSDEPAKSEGAAEKEEGK